RKALTRLSRLFLFRLQHPVHIVDVALQWIELDVLLGLLFCFYIVRRMGRAPNAAGVILADDIDAHVVNWVWQLDGVFALIIGERARYPDSGSYIRWHVGCFYFAPIDRPAVFPANNALDLRRRSRFEVHCSRLYANQVDTRRRYRRRLRVGD